MEADEMAATAAPEVMADEDLASMLSTLHRQAVGYLTSEVAAEQETALNFYYGRPFGDEQDGRSKVVDLTVAEIVDNAKAAILKPFLSSDQVVQFQPRGPEDEEAAQQATELVNYLFFSENEGTKIIHDALHDGLLQKVGVAKVWWEDTSRQMPETVTGDAGTIEAIAADIIEGPFETDEPGVFSAVVQKPYEDGCIKIENVPPEEFRISPYARNLKDAVYLGHTTLKSRSALIEMGFERDEVEAIGTATPDPFDDTRKLARYADEDEGGLTSSRETNKSQELVEVHHEFVLMDYDGDGISERREVIRAGNVILYNEAVDDHPFVCWCSVPMPHKVYGRSYADLSIDMQRIRSVLQRQMLDNLYLSNNPRPELPLSAERNDGTTLEDLDNMVPGAIIRTNQAGQLGTFGVAFVADKAFPMLEYTERQIMARTGVALVGQGLDPNALKRERTATEASIEDEGRNTRLEMVARFFSEDFVRPLMLKMLKLVVKYQPRAKAIRLRGEWVQVDPRSWNADMDCSISVGLGVNSKRESLAAAQLALQTMERIASSPFASLLLSPKGVYEAVKKLFEAAGFRNVDAYLQEPTPEKMERQGQNEQPDPETMKVQAELQMKQAEQQMRAQEAAQKMEMAREESSAKLQFEREKAEFEAQMAQDKAQREYDLALAKMQAEMDLAREKMRLEVELSREAASMNAAAKLESASFGGDAGLATYRAGGALDE